MSRPALPDREAVAKLIEDGICLIDACGQVCVDGDSIKRIASNILALFAPSPAQAERARDPRFIAAKDLTDDELSAEHARISAQCDEFEAGARNGEEMGGGSPGEMMYERFGEIANERGRRAMLSAAPKEPT